MPKIDKKFDIEIDGVNGHNEQGEHHHHQANNKLIADQRFRNNLLRW